MKSLIEGATDYQQLVERFSPFTGYFPPIVDGAIMEIILSTIPGHPKRELVSKGQLAERFLTLQELERLKTDIGNEPVEKTVEEAVAANKPLALYLRNFLFGVSIHKGRTDRYDIPQVLSAASTTDFSLQSALMKMHTGLTWIKISNPAADPLGIDNSLILGNDDWQQPVRFLAAHAAVIVMYYFTLSPGVSTELNLLKDADAAEKTLIIISPDDPEKNPMAITIRQLFGSEEDAARAIADSRSDNDADKIAAERAILSAFPNKIFLPQDEAGWEKLEQTLKKICSQTRPLHDEEPAHFPPRPRPAWEALLLAKEQAMMDFSAGQHFYQQQSGEEAEHAFIRSIAFSHWARDPLGRALGFLLLAKTERLLKYPNEAVQCYENTLDIFERLLPDSGMAHQYFKPVATDLIDYLKELKDERRADLIIRQLNRVETLSGNAPIT